MSTLIYLFNYLFKSVWTHGYLFILAIIIHYYLFSCSNCPRFDHWEFLKFGSYVLLATFHHHFWSTSLLSIYSIFEHGWNYIMKLHKFQFFFFPLDCFGCVGWTSCFIVSFEDGRLEETHWESHDRFTGMIIGIF